MGHSVKDNGVFRVIIGGRTSVDGIEREIPLGKTSVNGREYDIPFNRKIGTLPVGTSVFTNLDGELREFIIVQQGLPSSMYSETCNDTWLLMKDVYDDGVWPYIIDNLDSIFLPKFDAEIGSIIKQVKIPYYSGQRMDKVYTGEEGQSAKIFFLSVMEVGAEREVDFLGNVKGYIPDDGVKLSYFDLGENEPANQKRLAYLNGTPHDWWTRSKHTRAPGDTDLTDLNAHIVDSDGSLAGYHIVTHYVHPDGSQFWSNASCGMRPAFILPSETLVNYKYHILP